MFNLITKIISKKLLLISVLIISLFLVSSCLPQNGTDDSKNGDGMDDHYDGGLPIDSGNNPGDQNPDIPLAQKLSCNTDADCVPAECCHPTSAVNKDYAPNCAAVLCSADCKPNTLDCQQGEIKCINNECTAILNSQI